MTRRGSRAAALALVGGLLAGLAVAALFQRARRPEAPSRNRPTTFLGFNDYEYWYLDIYDDFFTRKSGPEGELFYESRRPRSNESRFPARKAGDAYRVFIVGGSVAGQYDSAPEWAKGRTLAAALKRALPGRRIEVANCGMGAYDSYRDSLVLTEVLRYEPDLIVLMSGNNEFIVSGGRPPRRVLWALRTRRWLGFLRRRPTPPSPRSQPTRPDFLEAFAANLRGMILSARRAGVAVIPCTLPRQLNRPPRSPLPFWRRDFFEAWDLWEKGSFSAAEVLLRKRLERLPDDSPVHYLLARCLERRGDLQNARREYKASQGQDPINPIIRKVAEELDAPVCDLEAAFDRLPQATQGGLLFRDPTHWYRYADPMVSHLIARTLARSPGAAKGPVDASWLAGAGPSWTAPRADPGEMRSDFVMRLSWTAWDSADSAPLLSETTLLALADLQSIDPARFASLRQLKPQCRGTIALNKWTRNQAAEFERRWTWTLAHVGELHRRQGRPRQALSFFEEALARDPDSGLLDLNKALALRALGRRQEASRLLDSMAGLETRFPEVRYTRELWGLRPRGGPPEPEEAAFRGGAPPEQREIPHPLRLRAEQYAAAGLDAEALALLRPALYQEPPDETLLFLAMRAARKARDQKAYETCLTRAERLPLQPQHAAILANELRELGRPQEALASLARALALHPRDAKLLNDKGVLEALQGRLPQAEADLRAAVAADPDLGSAHISLMIVRSRRGNAAGARTAYRAALSRRSIQEDADLRRRLQEAWESLPR